MSDTICIDLSSEEDVSTKIQHDGTLSEALKAVPQNQTNTSQKEKCSKAPEMACTICLESMDEEGVHRAVCLKCGHIFGDHCIRRWLLHKKTCPQCNERAKAANITVLYNLPRVLGNKDVDELQQRLKAAEEEKKNLQSELQRIRSSFVNNRAVAQRSMGCPLASGQPSFGPPNQCSTTATRQQGTLTPSHLAHAGPSAHAPATLASSYLQIPPYQMYPSSSTTHPNSRQYRASLLSVGARMPVPSVLPPPTQVRNCPEQHNTAKRMRFAEPEQIDLTECSQQPSQLLRQTEEVVVSGAPQVSPLQTMPCHLVLSQVHNLTGARCFDMDVQSGLLVVPDVLQAGRNPAGRHRIRKVSLLCPDAPGFMPLPLSVEMVHCVALQSQRQLLLVGTKGANVVMLSTRSNNSVAEFKLPGLQSAWASCASWLPGHPDQALIGFSNGVVARMDLRRTSSPLEIMLPHLPAPGQVHTILTPPANLLTSMAKTNTTFPSQSSSQQTQQAVADAALTPTPTPRSTQPAPQELAGPLNQASAAVSPSMGMHATAGPSAQSPALVALAACPAGAFCYQGREVVQAWSSASLQRGTCESVCCDQPSATVVLSFRHTPPGAASQAPASHLVLQAAPDGVQGVKTFELRGHTSKSVLTRCCLLGDLPDSAGRTWLAGADEASRCPWIWSLESKQVVQVLDPHPAPLLQLSAGHSNELGYILGASCSRQLRLYSMHSRE